MFDASLAEYSTLCLVILSAIWATSLPHTNTLGQFILYDMKSTKEKKSVAI